ncbi:MAG: hypothetical protein AB1778_01665 [Candidatus Bipolaricaulota bacterium]
MRGASHGRIATILVVVGLSLPGMAVSLCSYRPSETSIADARAAATYRYYDDATTAGIDVNAGTLSLDALRLVDAPAHGLTLSGSLSMALDAFVPGAWLARCSGSYRLYPWHGGLFYVFGGSEAVAVRGALRPSLDARVGLGLGRYSDVSPLARAMRIEEVLLDLGALRGPLSNDVLLYVAGLVAERAATSSVQDVVAELKAVVEFDGGTQLDARALLSIEEILASPLPDRFCGWSAQIGVGYELLDPFGALQTPVVVGSFDAAMAVSPRDQWLVQLAVSCPLALRREGVFTAHLGYAMDLGGASTMTAAIDVVRLQPGGGTTVTTTSAGLALEFRLGIGAVGLEVGVARSTGDPGWSLNVALSASVELL